MYGLETIQRMNQQNTEAKKVLAEHPRKDISSAPPATTQQKGRGNAKATPS